MDDKGTLKGGFSWFPAYRPANAVMIGLRVGFRVQVDTPLLLRTFRVGKVRDSLGQIVWNFGRDFQPCVGFRDYSPHVRLVEFQYLHVGAMLSHQTDDNPLHSVGHCLTNYRHIELILFTDRQNFALRPGLVHLVSRRLEDERARCHQRLVPSRA